MTETAIPLPAIEKLQGDLFKAIKIRSARTHDPGADDYTQLKTWQSNRLAATYADLLADARYGPAAKFFLSDLYGAKDFSERDAETLRVMPILTSMLPARALVALADALKLDALSESLDNDMVAALRSMGHANRIDEKSYALAYQRCGRVEDRKTQIALTENIGASLDRLTRLPLLHGLLKMMRGPAQIAGLTNLQCFLERGFDAFKHMGVSNEFLSIIVGQETQLMQDILAGRGMKNRQEQSITPVPVTATARADS